MEPIKVGLLGFGTVGSGTFDVLCRNQQEISRRAGRGIEITRIAVRNRAKAEQRLGDALRTVELTADFASVVNDPSLDIVAEMIGGTDIARELVLCAIKNGKHVVTANKALLAVHGTEIFEAADAHGVIVAFEAAVAGGIPIIKVLREGLTANRIQYIAGIINGTTNFILSEMRERGLDFETALANAQQLGYAEADPTFDIEGIDAAHKATIMAAIAFGIPVQFESAYIEGITHLDILDIYYAEELGYRIKLLGIVRRTKKGIELRVHPTLIPAQRLIANVQGAMNAVLVYGDAVGATLYYGTGAGAEPTASAVVADLVDVTRLNAVHPNNRVPHLAFQPDLLVNTPIIPINDIISSYYLRLRVAGQIGVLADITRILATLCISIDVLLQKKSEAVDANQEGEIDIIVITHKTLEKNINTVISHIEALSTVRSRVTRLRMEALN
ncbi:homoserine dehydrogenase [Candidatus Vallotia cooleyia]|uniref:homoserine dehydrogenase n=1 Tax=Candidatus Vallotiella adelgis TaxID=1177211 RepID=UPI001D028B52|nr:homoserine dehydrogenase [Candidatus Vallotia cooleyia]UDG81930.1 Homoserine dehydrogenase [Candidatus Vallotia cooleyia]